MTYKTFLRIIAVTMALSVNANRGFAQVLNPNHSIGPINGIYNYNYTQTPAQLVELYPAAFPNVGLTYQWYSSTAPTAGFTPISGATSSSYSPPPLTATSVTTYYYRTSKFSIFFTIASNIIKIKVVSVNWEDINYIREHDVLNTGQTTWTAVDQLPIGSKLQTTNYLDGMGRSVEEVSKQTATPASGSTTWGDVLKFSQYDGVGREPIRYLPYTTTNQSGSFKTTPLTDEASYYANPVTYNETSAFTTITFDNSPLNRVNNIKESGASWAASAGNTATYDMNTVADNVQILTTDYTQGDAPVDKGIYPANSLYKMTYTDVNGNQVIEFKDMAGSMILKKTQVVALPGAGDTGWSCVYYVYDDFGQPRFQIQPDGVQYLDANGWSFAGTNGATVLAEQVFQYNYDDKGRTIWKKAPGAAPINLIYDGRDRPVFTQDGNQAALPVPQWTTTLYDVLDRTVMSALFNTTETIATLQTDISGAPSTSTVFVANPVNCGSTTVPVTISLCPTSLNGTSLNSATSTVVLKYLFYDNYSFPNPAAFNTSYTNLTAYPTSDPNVIPIAQSLRTYSQVTGTLVRVMGSTSTFLGSTIYFDEKGHEIQTLSANIRSGTDITTMQYRFDGRLLSTCNSHTNASAGYTSFITLNKYVYDNIGRVVSVQKQIGTNAFKTTAAYDYDDMSRVSTKHLDPNYNNPNSGLPDLESLNYSFNIHNQITGINQDYALKNPANYNKWGHFFGLLVGYDKKSNVFANAQLDGQVGGQLWNTQGDDAQRKYDYSYDNANRLINATFAQQQHPTDGFSNGTVDFSVTGISGQITYDNNGNLQTMLQKGVMPGQSAPITVDDLRYAYNSYSNRLQSVTDQMTATTYNGLFGDFKDGANAAGTADYVYDANGNIVVDLNKNAQSLYNSSTGTYGAAGTNGIHYNYMNKADQIRIVGQGTIEIIYSGDGKKLQRVFIPETAGSSSITTYIDQYVYQESSTTLTLSSLPPFSGTGAQLAYINVEEGRIRAVTPTSTNNGYDALSENGNIVLPASPTGGGSSGAWDYFVMDYQRNVRMILTEETHTATNQCSMELTSSRPTLEDPVFGQTGTANEVEATRMATPGAWTGNSSAYVSHLGNLSGHTLGPNSLQKVMAGDKVTASVQYYYPASGTSSNPNIVNNLLANMLALVGGGSATSGTLAHGNAANITTQLNADPNFVNAVEPSNATSGTPQAYLTVLFFDERFNFIGSADGGLQQAQVRSTDAGNPNASPLAIQSYSAPKNGYAYVYVSNRSDQDVYFDNLLVSIAAGNIIEENHYYAFGLKISAISSHKLGDAGEGKLSNPYQYNDKEMLDENTGLDWYDYGFRSYDPQIGRFPQLDPLTDYYPELTPYQYASNDPITNDDLDGLEGCPMTAGMVGYGAAAAAASGLSTLARIANIASISLNLFNDINMAASQGSQGNIAQQLNTQNAINGQFSSDGAGDGSSTSTGSPHSPGGQGSKPGGNGPNVGADDSGDPGPDDDINHDPPNPCNDKYKDYDRTRDVETYNCAGLAFRNYQYMGDVNVVINILEKNKKTGPGKEGDIKFWLWTYDIHLELEDGTVMSQTSQDFHIVSGVIGPGGKDPTSIFTKNGARPVFGPGKPLDWKPAAKGDQYTSNNRFNTPAFYNGRKVMRVRTNMVQRIYVLPCRSY